MPKTIILLSLSIALLSCKKEEQPFDKAKWKVKGDLNYPQRESMIDDLMANHLHNNLKYSEVKTLLGEPENINVKDSSIIGYTVMEDYGWDIDPVETKTLFIQF